MQQLSRLRIDRSRIVEERRGVLVAHDPRQLRSRVVELAVADHVDLAGRDQLLLDVGDRHGLRELLRLAPGPQRHVDRHVVAGLPAARIDIDPGVAEPYGLQLLAVLADGRVQQRKDVVDTFRHDGRDQLETFSADVLRPAQGRNNSSRFHQNCNEWCDESVDLLALTTHTPVETAELFSIQCECTDGFCLCPLTHFLSYR